MTFANPLFLILLALLPAFMIWHKKWQRKPYIQFSKTKELQNIKKHTNLFTMLQNYLPYLILAILILALARPQTNLEIKEVKSEGISIITALDVSGSMAAEDLLPNRLIAAKKTIESFINKRNLDQIGLIIFGSAAYTQCPLTLDYSLLNNLLSKVEIGAAGQETAIGMAIATALNRLKESKTKNKILILVTDGENNKGKISPLNAAQLAQTLGIKIYCIGIGKKGGAPIPYNHPNFGKQYYKDPYGRPLLTRLDEETLKQIANITNGDYFRAENIKELEQIYKKIDALEKTVVKTKTYNNTKEHFPKLLTLLLGLFILNTLLKIKQTRTLP